MSANFTVVDLNYVSLYYKDHQAAVSFYTQVFGPPETQEIDGEMNIHGWKMGSTWLTIFKSNEGTAPDQNHHNAEFAIQVSRPEEVDVLYDIFVAAGAKAGWEPKDTEMYDPMRFAYVDDPFGVRIDIICPIPPPNSPD